MVSITERIEQLRRAAKQEAGMRRVAQLGAHRIHRPPKASPAAPAHERVTAASQPAGTDPQTAPQTRRTSS